jgi:hypothetical protein
MRGSSLWLALASCVSVGSTVQAATNPISAAAGKDWRHDLTGTVLPARIGEFSRKDIADYGNQKLDILATYEQPQSRTTATLYVYRAGLPDVSIWHDRIVRVMAMGRLGAADVPKLQTTFFTPAGQGGNSGVRSVIPLAGKGFTSSGVAMFRHDDWLIVVRMSSGTIPAADLDGSLTAFVEALTLSPARQPAPEAYRITPCAKPFPDQPAARAARDMSGGLLAGMLMQAIDNGKLKTTEAKDTTAPHYCSDPDALGTDYAAYRDEKEANSYLVAVGDAGNVVWIAPDGMATLLDPKKGSQYSMMLTTVAKRINYTPFTAMPSPTQVMEIVQSERPVSLTDRPIGKSTNKTITINPD